MNILCEVELNAFARSKKIAAVFFSFSWLSSTVPMKNNTASLEDFLFGIQIALYSTDCFYYSDPSFGNREASQKA